MHKILLVGHADDSMEPAYDIISVLREFGYATDICHINDDDKKPSRILASQVLDDDTSLSGYDGVVFLDDGGDTEAAIKLAKKALKKEIVLGGHGTGVLVLNEADALKDKYVCDGFDEEIYDGAEKVKAPSVRSDDIVTSVGACTSGFTVLLVDALGGKIKHIVRSKSSIPVRSALIVAPISTWSSYWPLAERMRSLGSTLVISDWDEVDVKTGVLESCAMLDPERDDIMLLGNQPIPRSVWFRDTSMSPRDRADAVASLERIGCVNVNSSEAIKTCSSDSVLELLKATGGFDGKVFTEAALDDAMDELMSAGFRTVSRAPSGSHKKPIKVAGRGDTAIVTRETSSGKSHLVLNRASLKHMVSRAFNRGKFVVSDSRNRVRLGDVRFELVWTMRRGPDGWRPASRFAQGGGMTCHAQEVLRLVFPDEWEPLLQDADMVAQIVSVVLQSLMQDSDELSEMGLMMVINDEGPVVKDVDAVPDPKCEEATAGYQKWLSKFADSLCLAPPAPQEVPEENGVAEMASALDSRAGDPIHKRVIERELAHEDIWLQPDGSVAMGTCDGVERLDDFSSLIDRLKEDAVAAVQNEIEAIDSKDKFEERMASRISRRARHRYRIAMEMAYLMSGEDERVKVAGIYPSSVAGPFSHLELPIHERVFEWKEGDDWLEDREKAISDQRRYNPEYEKITIYDDEGFYYVWDEQRRMPTEWMRMLRGDTVYPTRNLLSPGKLY